MRNLIQAAGAVCWRIEKGELQVLLIHRRIRKDVSLPKGKLDPGETAPQAAVREVLEETGYRVVLGPPVDTVEYEVPTGPKIVHYWAAQVSEEEFIANKFRPNNEVFKISWVTPKRAKKALTYDRDRQVIENFERLIAHGAASAFKLIILRHGVAVDPFSWDGPDSRRPLQQRGHEQARQIVASIRAYGPEKIYSSTALRCESTVAPLSAETGLAVKAKDWLSQDSWDEDGKAVEKHIAKRIEQHQTTVLCSHGPVIPQILSSLAHQTKTEVTRALMRASELAKGSFTVVHVVAEESVSGILAIENYAS